MNELITNTLNNYGVLGVQLLKTKISPLSATGKTVNSITHEVIKTNDLYSLVIFGREFINTLETGRGPRKSSTPGGFEDSMLEYMRAKGIGSELSDKKRKQLARFLTWKINKEGDKTFRRGGRMVYSDDLEKFVRALHEAVVKDFRVTFRSTLKAAFHDNNT